MPFKIIKGSFHVTGYQPDGDSVRFKADDTDLLFDLEGPPPKLNNRDHTQLRLEGIDALETHFSAGSGFGSVRQPPRFAQEATDFLLNFLGISNVEWDDAHKGVVSANDGTRGFILSRAVEKNRRPVAFIFAGDPPGEDGEDFRLEADFLASSYNDRVLREGFAYATFYWSLFHDLRDAMTESVEAARAAKNGLYAVDVTSSGFAVDSIADLTDKHVIMPKLFRRLATYFAANGSVIGFKAALEESAEPVLDIASANFTHFDTFVEQDDGSTSLRLTVDAEDLVFDPMPQRASDNFETVVEEKQEEAVAMRVLNE